MKKQQSVFFDKRLWIFIIGVIILPNFLEQISIKLFNLRFDKVIWREILDTSIFLLISTPFFIYLLKKTDKDTIRLEHELYRNQQMTKELEEKTFELSHMAYHDYLTGLPNRYKLNGTLDQIIKEDKNRKTKLTVFFLYVDQYKITNDVIGHELTDKFIIHIAKKINSVLPKGSFLSRYSGNEFVILLKDIKEKEHTIVASEIIGLFSIPFHFDNEEILTTASMGIAIYPYHGEDHATLLKNADIAMYSTKDQPGNTYQYYSSELNEGFNRTINLIKGLKSAIEQEQFILYYQPQVNLKTGLLDGVEALIRWEHPEYGLIPPNDFISLAEETGEIIAIGNWAMEEACRQAKIWQDKTGIKINIAVNVSILQLEAPGFIDHLKKVLEDSELDPKYLEIEITESMMRNLEEVHVVFDRLKKIGVCIAIDDFGTGYSSLSVLGFLPIHYLKIDRSFVRDMMHKPKINSIVKTIIDMGKNLNLQIIAEGIEEESQLELLKEYGCNTGQGYYFSKPLCPEEVKRVWFKEK